jgi:hypothetical protein
VKEPVGQRIGLETRDRRHRVLRGAREHVVPLEHLVQHDPVDETA